MPKVTLDMSTFKALASDTRLDILRALDGKNMSLNDISRITRLNKATLHEHLAKLNEAGLIKKSEREGHKWVYYRLTWKGEGLLHPENTKIVVMFSTTFISLFIAVVLLVNFAQPVTVGMATTSGDTTYLYEAEDVGVPLLTKSYNFNYIGSVNATYQTVRDLSVPLQMAVQAKNSIGVVYTEADIEWNTRSNKKIEPSQSILNQDFLEDWAVLCYTGVKGSIIKTDELNFTDKELENLSKFLQPNAMVSYNKFTSGSSYETEEKNDTDNETRNLGIGEDFFGYLPSVQEMIATVQDITLLYYAIGCIAFFGAAFTVSSWKFWKSRKPIL